MNPAAHVCPCSDAAGGIGLAFGGRRPWVAEREDTGR